MKNYEINETTMAIIPINNESVQVYEEDASFLVQNNSMAIMDESCQYFGSSLSGRIKGTENLIGVHYKAPIIVEESKEIIFFPLASSRYHDTPWLSLKHIKSYTRTGKGILLEFKNGEHLLLDFSYGIIDNQILRATRLESVLRARKKESSEPKNFCS